MEALFTRKENGSGAEHRAEGDKGSSVAAAERQAAKKGAITSPQTALLPRDEAMEVSTPSETPPQLPGPSSSTTAGSTGLRSTGTVFIRPGPASHKKALVARSKRKKVRIASVEVVKLPIPSRAGFDRGSAAQRRSREPRDLTSSTEEEEEEGLETTAGDTVPLRPPLKRKRGRPPTTGEYYVLQARKEEAARTKIEKEESETKWAVQEMMDDAGINVESDPEGEDGVRVTLSENTFSYADGVVKATCARDSIKLMVSKSRNLKGGFKRDLKIAADASLEVVKCMAGRGKEAEKEISRLAEHVRALKEENRGMKESLSLLLGKVAQLEARLAGDSRDSATELDDLAPANTLQQGNDGMEIEEDPPAFRPPLQGKVKKLEDNIPKVLSTEERAEKESTRLLRENISLKKKISALESETSKTRRSRRPDSGKTRPQPPSPSPSKRGTKKSAPPGMTTAPARSAEKAQKSALKAPVVKAAAPTPKAEKKLGDNPSRPPANPHPEQWSAVVGRKSRKSKGGQTPAPPPRTPSARPRSVSVPGGQKTKGAAPAPPKAAQRKRGRRRRAPQTAAVTLTCEDGSYAEVLRTVRSKIALADLGITDLKVRTGVTGARVLEIPGEGSHAKADALRDRMMEAVGHQAGVKIARPTKTADFLIIGLEDSTDPQEIAQAVSTAGGCAVTDIKVGDPKANNRRVISAWIRCPVGAADKLLSAGTLTVGWARIRVMPLAARPLQCFRCLEKGHTRANCRATVDRSHCCYRCGVAGHTAASCTAPAQCMVCRDRGVPANHRWGGPACNPPKKRGGNPKGPKAPQASQSAVSKEMAKMSLAETPLTTAHEEPKSQRKSQRSKKKDIAPSPLAITGGEDTAQVGLATPMEVEQCTAPLQSDNKKEAAGLEGPPRDAQCP